LERGNESGAFLQLKLFCHVRKAKPYWHGDRFAQCYPPVAESETEFGKIITRYSGTMLRK